MAEEQHPGEEELRRALDELRVQDVLLQSLSLSASIAFGRLPSTSRDLVQVRLAIEALRALEPVLREGGVDEAVVRDLEQARANLQLAYADAVSQSPAAAQAEADSPDDAPAAGSPGAPGDAPGDAS